jgi:enoyl-CoA hydratase/carnithine racemase
MTDFTYAVDDDGVAVITWDVPGKSMNVLTRAAFSLVENYLDRALADPEVRGIVVTSGKETFATRTRTDRIPACRATVRRAKTASAVSAGVISILMPSGR